MAAGGYPGDYEKGDIITGIDTANSATTKVFHAGTTVNEQGDITTHGGRVLCVTSLGENVTQAQQRAYEAVAKIRWDKVYYRTDIGYRAIARER